MPSKTHEWLGEYLRREQKQIRPLEEDRAQMEQQARLQPLPPGVTEETLHDLMESVLLTPPNPRDDLVIVQIHGGGFRTGTPHSLRAFGGLLALHTGARVLCPRYRLAPENPYPAGLDDCEAAYLYASRLVPEARIIVGGDSAGAGLAAALLLRRRDAGDKRLLAGLLLSGVLDLRPERWTQGSWVENADGDAILPGESGLLMTTDYAQGADPADPGISPLCADLAGLPPLLIFASSSEMLLDDSLRFAVKAGKAGVETVLEIWPGMHHSWPAMAAVLPEALEAVSRVTAFVGRVIGGHVVDGRAVVDNPAILERLP